MPPASIDFRALQLANEQRNAYGLRYNDFTRYRKHCANRTHRLRSTLKMTHGKGKDFKKLPTFTKEIVKDAHLQLLLFEAERAWAYAQELTNSSLKPENENVSSSLRHSATGRFRRAVNWSTQLLSLCQVLYTSSRLSAENLIEVTVYTLILNGRFLRYRDEFTDALIQLSVARSLLDDLANTSSTSRDQALAILFSDEIGPEIRYCAHELGHSKAYDVNGIVAELAPKHRDEVVESCHELLSNLRSDQKVSSKSKLEQRMWEGQPVPVRYPELVDVLIRVQEAEEYLDDGRRSSTRLGRSKLGETAYDKVLSALSDAEDAARKLQESQQLTGTNTSPSSAGVRDIHFVHAYIVYQLLARRIQRDLLLMNTLLSSGGAGKSKEQATNKASQSTTRTAPVDHRLYPAIVKLLDAILQSLAQMRTLSIVDDNPDLSLAVEARISLVNGRRCLYLAQCYKLTNKFPEALTLLQRATIYVRETTSSLSLSESDLITNGSLRFFPLNSETVKELENAILADGLQHKRDWFAYNGGSASADPETYKKPLFFNIALNYVELDMDRLQQRAGKEPVVAPAVTGVSSTTKAEAVEKKSTLKAKAEENLAPTANQQQAPGRGGLSSLLGGWWSK